MVVKKRDFQKIAGCLNEFLSKLSCDESTAGLRDSINLVLFCMQAYYKKLRSRSLSNIVSPRMTSLGGSLILNGGVSPVSPACGIPDQFEWKWYNLESPRVSASLGTDEFSSLPLIMQAGKSGDKELLMELLEKDPEAIHQVDGLGRNVVMYTIHGNSVAHTECLEILINMNCDLNIQANDDSTALHVAAHDTNTSALSILLKHKALCNIEDNQGRTPLHWAASNPSIDNVKLLLQNGGDLNAKDREGLTAAMWACHFDQLQNLQTLQMALARIDPEEDALLKESDNCGQRAIHWAVRGMGTLECLQALLTDQTALLRDNDGKTVLHTAAEQGNARACEMILEVTGGTEGLLDTDSSNRTPLHLAVICGQGEVVNFLLDLGADPWMQDAFGASSWDYIQNKQLNYCMMVVRAHPQFKQLLPGKAELVSELQAPDKQEKQLEIFKSTAHLAEVCSETDITKPERSHDKDVFWDQRNDVSELQGFDVQNDIDVEDILETYKENQLNTEETKSKYQEINTSMPKEEQATCLNTSRRQTTLTRQSGFHSESELQNSQEAATFDLRTKDGDVLVVVSNVGNKDEEEHLIDVEDGQVEIDCEDNLEYSSTQLRQGRGSASSVHSEPDNSDNCSVSVGLSVSSLGSDNEEIIHEEDYADGIMKVGGWNGPEEEEHVQEIYPESSKIPTQHPKQTPQFQSSSQEYASSSRQTKQSPKQQDMDAREISKANVSSAKFEEEIHDMAPKKKKGKKKKQKQTTCTVVELPAPFPPPRGFVAPLNPPIVGPPGAFKLGSLDQRGVKPGPWEHSGLGPLRHTRPEPSPPSPRLAKQEDFPKGQMQFKDSFNPLDRNSNVGGFERPTTPEPPRSPRDVSGPQQQHLFYPSPPSSTRSASDGSFRGPMEEREMNYGPSGPSHGLGTHVNSQTLLKNMDTGRDSKMDSWSVRNMTHTDKVGMFYGSPGQQRFGLHGPVPHPPNR